MTADLGDITTYLSQGRSRPAAVLLAAVGSFAATFGHTPREIRTLDALAAGLLPHMNRDDLELLADISLSHTELPHSLQRAIASLEEVIAPAARAARDDIAPKAASTVHLEEATDFDTVYADDDQPIDRSGPDVMPEPEVFAMAEVDPMPLASVDLPLNDPFDAPDVITAVPQPEANLVPIGGRVTLDLSTVLALIEDSDIDECAKLVRNAKGDLPYAVIRRLTMLAQDWPLLAQALADRPDMSDTDLIPLFPHLGKRGRHRVIAALELLALKELVHRQTFSARPDLTDEDTHDIIAATHLAENGDATQLTEVIARRLGVAVPLIELFILDRGGEALTIALRATGLPTALAAPIMQLNAAFFAQSENLPTRLKMYEGLSVRACQIAIDHWRGPFVRAQQANPTTGLYRPSDILRPASRAPHSSQTKPMGAVSRL